MNMDSRHRNYPPPETTWAGHMVWHDLLFAHWSVPAEALRRVLPAPIPLDTYEGRAYLSLVPFHMTDVRPRGVPALPWLSAFPEVNVRTYVTIGGRAGVYFFSLDVTNLAAMAGARAVYFLPYFLATMAVSREGDWIYYTSQRSGWHGAPAHLIARYRPTGDVFHPQPGTLEHWLTERYCLYTVDSRDQVHRAEIHHEPWPLQPAEGALFRNTMTAPLGLELAETPELMHYARRLEVVAWLPGRVEEETTGTSSPGEATDQR